MFVRAGMQELVWDSLPEIASNHIIVVPAHRNTLPELMWALSSVTDDPNEPVLFKSVDHFILNEEVFATSLQKCLDAWHAHAPALTLICTPFETFNSNDGYCIADNSGTMLRFLEKPSREEFDEMVRDHQAFRFPFIFVVSQQTCLDVLSDTPEPWADQARQVLLARDDAAREQAFLPMGKMDLRGIWMMQTNRMRVLPIDYEFMDIGRFEELYQLNTKDADGNVIRGKVILGMACRGSMIINQTDSPLVVMSAEDAVIIQTDEGSFAAPFRDAAKIGDVYKQHINPH